jgi:phosphoribosylanthranilate isomerase
MHYPRNGGVRVERLIKICGLRNQVEATLALEAGATALGFLVGLTHLADDAVDDAQASRIVRHVPVEVETVMVTHLLDAAEIARRSVDIGVRTIQVHGALPVAAMRDLRRMVPLVRLIKAVHVTGEAALDDALSYAAVADALLLDSRTADRLGGTGLTHDWSISRRVVAGVAPLPVYLAGGLTPDNVARAVRAVGPAGVDVNSGVEDASGNKDPQRLGAFVANARRALAALA